MSFEMNTYEVTLKRANVVVARITVCADDIYEAHENAELICRLGRGTTQANIRRL